MNSSTSECVRALAGNPAHSGSFLDGGQGATGEIRIDTVAASGMPQSDDVLQIHQPGLASASDDRRYRVDHTVFAVQAGGTLFIIDDRDPPQEVREVAARRSAEASPPSSPTPRPRPACSAPARPVLSAPA
ncbi:hypothetical protein ACGFJC_52930 [Nonomuraea fuscirosea]|uniref:hypothetical protein n=1 Tax=Nonomuraea fuscirosea TaxID=1291556 RepID=UPI00347AEE51